MAFEVGSSEMQKRLDRLTRYFYSVVWTFSRNENGSDGMNEIIPGVFVGNAKSATDFVELQQRGITHVLNVRRGVDWVAMVEYEEMGITFKHVAMADVLCFDMKQNIDEAMTFISTAVNCGGKVLVHCKAGKSRSPTVVAAYLIAVKKYDVFSASAEIVKNRPRVFPNLNFLHFLCELEENVRSGVYKLPTVDF